MNARPRHAAGLRTLLYLGLLAAPVWAGPDKAGQGDAMTIPSDFPRFVVPGHEREMERLRELFWLHYKPAGPLIPLWDKWMPMSTLWPAIGQGAGLEAIRGRWAAALAGRPINAEGFVHTQQHDGPAHAEGWPFPLWTQAGGIGWHFASTGVPGYEGPKASPDGWKLTGGRGGRLRRDHRRGALQLPAVPHFRGDPQAVRLGQRHPRADLPERRVLRPPGLPAPGGRAHPAGPGAGGGALNGKKTRGHGDAETRGKRGNSRGRGRVKARAWR